MKVHHKILFGVNLVLILLTILSYLAPFIDPAQAYLFSFFGLAYPWLLLANLCMIGIWIFLKKKFALLSAATIVAGWTYACGFINFSNISDNLPEQVYFDISSYNMQNAYVSYSSDPRTRKRLQSEYESFLDTFYHVEIFCAQEANHETRKMIDHVLDFRFSHFIEGKGAVIYSNYPIVRKGEIDFGTKTNSCLWADIALGNDTIRVYSVHLQSNRITSEAEKVANTRTIRDSATWIGIKGILSNYKTYVQRRSKQVKMLYNHKEASPYNVIICGDLNDPPQSFVYRTLFKEMKDSFKEKGNGIGTTYAGLIPALRIDYIFADKSFTFREHRIIKEKYSDHFPIVSTIQLP